MRGAGASPTTRSANDGVDRVEDAKSLDGVVCFIDDVSTITFGRGLAEPLAL